eukprot:1161215-Pelagomonas_calceolata.AAC.9
MYGEGVSKMTSISSPACATNKHALAHPACTTIYDSLRGCICIIAYFGELARALSPPGGLLQKDMHTQSVTNMAHAGWVRSFGHPHSIAP